MQETVQWVALFGMAGIGIVFVLDVRRWYAQRSVVTKQQRGLRIALIVLVEALFAMMIVGPMITTKNDPIGSLIYWLICLILGFAIVVLALFDLKAVAGQYVQLNRQMFRDLRGSRHENPQILSDSEGDDRREK